MLPSSTYCWHCSIQPMGIKRLYYIFFWIVNVKRGKRQHSGCSNNKMRCRNSHASANLHKSFKAHIRIMQKGDITARNCMLFLLSETGAKNGHGHRNCTIIWRVSALRTTLALRLLCELIVRVPQHMHFAGIDFDYSSVCQKKLYVLRNK